MPEEASSEVTQADKKKNKTSFLIGMKIKVKSK